MKHTVPLCRWAVFACICVAAILHYVEQAWHKLNFGGDDTLTEEAMYAAQLFDLADTDESNTLDEKEFEALCELIISQQGYDKDLQDVIVAKLLATDRYVSLHGKLTSVAMPTTRTMCKHVLQHITRGINPSLSSS